MSLTVALNFFLVPRSNWEGGTSMMIERTCCVVTRPEPSPPHERQVRARRPMKARRGFHPVRESGATPSVLLCSKRRFPIFRVYGQRARGPGFCRKDDSTDARETIDWRVLGHGGTAHPGTLPFWPNTIAGPNNQQLALSLRWPPVGRPV